MRKKCRICQKPEVKADFTNIFQLCVKNGENEEISLFEAMQQLTGLQVCSYSDTMCISFAVECYCFSMLLLFLAVQ